jgi:hypothetical protein
MWLLHFLPDAFLEFIVNAVLILGLVLTLLSFFVLKYIFKFVPPLAPYRTPIQVVSVVILAIGIYFKGGYSTEMIWREKVREVEGRLAEAEKKSEELNTELVAERKKKQKVIREYAVTVRDRIVEKEKIINADCKIVPEAINIVNDAARGAPIEK